MFNASPFVSPFPKSPFINGTKNEEQSQKKENKYLNFAADRQGCGMWRIGWPELHINMSNLGESTTITKMILNKDWYQDIKTIKLQRQASTPQKEFLSFLKSIQPELGFKLIYEVDDVVFYEEIPDYNSYKHAFANDEIRQNCVDMMRMVDEVTVTCKYMRDLFIEKIGKNHVSVVPNFPPEWWIGSFYNYKKITDFFEKNKNKPRILYSGSGAHFDVKNVTNQQDDFSHVLKFIVDNRHKYQFIFIGAYPPPLHPFIQNKEIEFHPWQSLVNYPKFIASLNPQLLLAPLKDIPFNRSKSDIKYIEGACLGIPCMCQDMATYQDAPDFLKFTDSEDLAVKVEYLLNWKNRSKYFKLIPELRKLGESRFLERPENIGAFMEALNTEYNSPNRRYMKYWND
jgi:hypothetical protein